VERSGVQFDMCPSCRGIWLDRGELENLMAAGAQTPAPPPGPASYAAPPPSQHRNTGYGERGEHGERGERGEGGFGFGGQGRKRGSIFDIFD